MLLTILAIIALALLITIIDSNTRLTESYYDISFQKLPAAFEGYRIAHISDLHNKTFGEDNIRLIERIDEFAPSIVVLTGDMLSRNSKDLDDFLPTAQILGAKYPTYFISGNHEQALKHPLLEELYQQLAACKVTVLDNQKLELVKDGQSIDLYGFSYSLEYYSLNRRAANATRQIKTLADAELGVPDPNRFTILLTHNPVYFEAYCQWGADLTLSGHIHGGMVRLPGLGGVFGAGGTLFPKYDAGIYSENNQHMIVSRGLGAGIFGFRLFNPADLVFITLDQDK